MSAAPCASAPTTYLRREPDQSALHGVVREHLGTFLASRDVPGHVRRALRRYLDCGVLARGFVRVRCPQCKAESLVAFSCKDRSFCPSCTARRAAETAAHLVDHVLPQVPHRQYVLALPPDLHVRVASDPALESRLLQLFTDELFELQRALAKSGDAARGGSVTLLQHFGSSLNLHVHFHTLALDGVYVPGDAPDAPPRFIRAPEPTPEQLRWLCSRVVERAARLVARGPWKEPAEERQTQVFKVHGAEPREPVPKRLHARVAGFDLHASAPMEAHERVAIERFARYALRGPIANGRLSMSPRDQLTYRLKAPRTDGTTALVLSPMNLLVPEKGRQRAAPLPPHSAARPAHGHLPRRPLQRRPMEASHRPEAPARAAAAPAPRRLAPHPLGGSSASCLPPRSARLRMRRHAPGHLLRRGGAGRAQDPPTSWVAVRGSNPRAGADRPGRTLRHRSSAPRCLRAAARRHLRPAPPAPPRPRLNAPQRRPPPTAPRRDGTPLPSSLRPASEHRPLQRSQAARSPVRTA